MRAYILCGGFGTRLSDVLKGGQKAVVDINGRPFLSLILEQLRFAGVTDVVLCVHYRADQMLALLPSLSAACGLPIQYVLESQPMGTGGAVLHALRKIPPNDRFLVMNADTYLDPAAYEKMRVCTRDTVLAVQVDDRSRYGSLTLAPDLELLALNEKGLQGPGPVNAGVYTFSAGALNEFAVVQCSMEMDLLPRLIERRQLWACEYSGAFVDIGTPDSLQAFKFSRGAE